MKEEKVVLFETAVLLIAFNRLSTVNEVFNQIKIVKPKRLYIASDGPRKSIPGEHDIVEHIRTHLVKAVDWECDINTLFRDVNLGCKIGVSSAISWFFDHEEQGIILEDDCVPSQSFFYYCEDLLNKYKFNTNISVISGDGRATLNNKIDTSYDFMSYSLIWGWASWRRVWEKYDVSIKDWPKNKRQVMKQLDNKPNVKLFWIYILNKIHRNKIDTWDYQLNYLLLKDKGLCIVPQNNLITNIGFGADATHTFDNNSIHSKLGRFELDTPYIAPEEIKYNILLNEYMNENSFSILPLHKRVVNKLMRILSFK